MQFENELFGLVQVQVQAEDPTLPRSHKRLLQRLLQAGSSCAAGGRRVQQQQQQQVLQWQEEPGQEPLGSIPGAELAIVEPANHAHSPRLQNATQYNGERKDGKQINDREMNQPDFFCRFEQVL